jgi:hypothetical protein
MKQEDSLVCCLVDLLSDLEGGDKPFVLNMVKLQDKASQPREQYFSTHIFFGKGPVILEVSDSSERHKNLNVHLLELLQKQ